MSKGRRNKNLRGSNETELKQIDIIETELNQIDIKENELKQIDIKETELKQIDIIKTELNLISLKSFENEFQFLEPNTSCK